MRGIALTVALLLAAMNAAFAWGSSGHAIIAEIAQRRLAPLTLQNVADLLGSGASLASIASWADDERVRDPATTRWHFVDIPRMTPGYDPMRDCALDAADGDLHQPLHAIGEEGGNGVKVTVVTKEGVNGNVPFNTNLHVVWDATLIDKTVWSWGTYVERLENGWLKTADANEVSAGTTIVWANESHQLAVNIMRSVPVNAVIDDEYRRSHLPVLDAQLSRAGLHLARTLNEAFASENCPAEQE
ncbi:S1/P1 nuclease [Phyllobacterium sp. K27]